MKIRTRKLFLIVVFCLAAATNALGQTTPQLVVWQKSGEKVYYQLADQPRTTFRGDLLIIQTNSVTTSYQRSNILRYTFEGNTLATGITPQQGMVIAQDNDGLTLRNLPEGTPVKLYDAAGRQLQSYEFSTGHPLEISLKNRPAGIYIVQIKDHSLKITRR